MASPMPCSMGKLRVPRVFELADVGALRRGVAGEGPDLFDLVAGCTHIMPRADGRGEKFVQTGAEVVGVQVGDFEVHETEGMRAVGEDFNSFGSAPCRRSCARAWSGPPS